MILAVDIGNSHIKVGAWDNEDLVFVSRMQTNVLRTQDEYAIDLTNIIQFNDCNASQFDGAIISCVVPQLSERFRVALRNSIRTKRVFLVGPGLKTGLNIKIDNPATLGADLVCASVAAIHKYTLPCIIVGLSTATSLFAIDGDGCFLGGVVSAGVEISLNALSQRTAQLPHISLENPGSVIGTNTIDSMKSGTVYGTAAMLDGLSSRMQRELGEAATVVAFGSQVAVAAHCEQEIVVDEHLVLEGLRLLYLKNSKESKETK